MINVSGIDWSKVTKAGEIAPPKFAPKGVTTFMQPPKQSVNLKKFIPQVAPKEEYISPYMELNKPISPEQKQVVMALGANIKKGDDLATIRQKFPEIADIGDKSLQALRANIMKGDSPEMIEKKFPELQWIKTKQTDDKYKYNIMNKPTQFLQGLREKAENIDIPVVEPLAKGVLGTAMLGTKGMRDVIQGGAGLLDKGIAGATGTDKVYKSGVAEDVFDVAQGSSNTLASVVAPVSVTALGTVMSALPKPVQQSVGDIFQNIGGFIAKTPGLKQWKESLPPERRAEFDNEVMGGLTALFFGAKNKLNLLKNPKAFVQENILNPQNVVKNIEQNVLNIPKNLGKTPVKLQGTADWILGTELPGGKRREKFLKTTGKTPQQYLNDIGASGRDIEGITKLQDAWKTAMKQADEGFSEIKGNYRFQPTKYKNVKLESIEYVGDAIRDMLEDIIDKKPKNTTEVNKYINYLRKYDRDGLSQTEVNSAKREFEKTNKFNYLRENNIDRYNRATNVDSAVREWQYKVAETRGFDLKAVNKQTQAIKMLVDKLGGQSPEMKGIGLSDWILAGHLTPESIALLIGKKIADSKWIRGGAINLLNKVSGRKQGLEIIDTGKVRDIQKQVDLERLLLQKFGRDGIPKSDTYGLPVRSNNRLGLPRQVESPTNVYKPRTDVVTPTGKVIPSKFKKVIEMGEATQPGTTKLDSGPQVVKLEGQENMPKTLPNTNLPKKMPKSPKPQEKQAVIEGEKVPTDLLQEAKKYKSAEEFIKANTLKKMREYVKNDLFTDWRFKDGDYIKTHIANKDIGDYIKKGDAVTLSLDKGPQGVKVMVMFDPVTDGGFVHKRVFNVNKDDFTSIREQANKKGLPVKETQPTKQVPEAKNIEEDLLVEARKYKSAEEFVNKQGTKVYHFTDSNFDELDMSKSKFGDVGKGFYTTDNIKNNEWGKNMKTFIIKKDAKVRDVNNISDAQVKEYFDAESKKLGKVVKPNKKMLQDYPTVIVQGIDNGMIKGDVVVVNSKSGGKNYIIKNKTAIKTDSELKKIREQANKKGLPVKETQPTKQVPEAKNIEEDLLAEARKYKSAEEFVDYAVKKAENPDEGKSFLELGKKYNLPQKYMDELEKIGPPGNDYIKRWGMLDKKVKDEIISYIKRASNDSYMKNNPSIGILTDPKAYKDKLKQIREQANKKGLPVKETQPTKQVPEAKNIEEDLLAEARKAVDIFVDELGLTKAEAQQEVSDMVKYSMTIEDLKDFDDFMGIYENNIHKLARDKGKQYDIDKFIPQLRKIREQANKKGLPVKETQPTKQVPEAKNIEEDLLAEARKYKSAEEFMNGLKEQAKSANTLPIEINFIDLYGKYDTDFRKLYSKTRVMRKGLEGKEIISEISRLKDIDTKFFEKAKEQLKKIREQANKNRIIK